VILDATNTSRFRVTRVVDPKRMDSSAKSLDRYTEPDEIADAVAFLAGPRREIHQRAGASGGRRLFAVPVMDPGRASR
jgi:2-hydroxycyclohexanecarboxyl-CoA dehydrogenase